MIPSVEAGGPTPLRICVPVPPVAPRSPVAPVAPVAPSAPITPFPSSRAQEDAYSGSDAGSGAVPKIVALDRTIEVTSLLSSDDIRYTYLRSFIK